MLGAGAESRLRTAGILAVVILVVGLAAGSIVDTTRVERGGGAGFMSGSPPSAPDDTQTNDEPSPLIGLFMAALVVLFVVGVLSNPREFLRRAGALAAAGTLLFGLLYLVLLSSEPSTSQDPQETGRVILDSTREAVSRTGLSEGPSTTSPALLLAAGVAILVMFGILAALTNDGSGRLGATGGEDPDADGDALAAMARTAGRAADRLEDADADVDNEVYRAWEEMTEHLEVANRGARTPGEFRTAALDAGMARQDVDLLTDLFEEVRYGGAPATSGREEEAAEALRRIETTYTPAEEQP